MINALVESWFAVLTWILGLFPSMPVMPDLSGVGVYYSFVNQFIDLTLIMTLVGLAVGIFVSIWVFNGVTYILKRVRGG